jgi:large subunit ribosomal protein L19
LYYLRDLRGKAAKIREKRDGVEGYGDGILSTPVAEPVSEPVSEVVAEPVALAQEVVAQPTEAAAQEVAEASAEVAQVDEQTPDVKVIPASDEQPKA